jgi:hypothetical protein
LEVQDDSNVVKMYSKDIKKEYFPRVTPADPPKG